MNIKAKIEEMCRELARQEMARLEAEAKALIAAGHPLSDITIFEQDGHVPRRWAGLKSEITTLAHSPDALLQPFQFHP